MSKQPDEFAASMAQQGVKPLTQRSARALPPRNKPLNPNVRTRRAAAVQETASGVESRSGHGIEWLGPHDVVEFKRHGIQHEVFKNLKQGRYEVGATLDLHRQRVDEARTALFHFLRDCQEHEIRCALVSHGKGQHSKPEPGEPEGSKPVSRIKSHVVYWLKGHEAVQAVSSCQPRDGGTGAVYVLLKKSEKARDRNRQHFRTDKG